MLLTVESDQDLQNLMKINNNLSKFNFSKIKKTMKKFLLQTREENCLENDASNCAENKIHPSDKVFHFLKLNLAEIHLKIIRDMGRIFSFENFVNLKECQIKVLLINVFEKVYFFNETHSQKNNPNQTLNICSKISSNAPEIILCNKDSLEQLLTVLFLSIISKNLLDDINFMVEKKEPELLKITITMKKIDIVNLNAANSNDELYEYLYSLIFELNNLDEKEVYRKIKINQQKYTIYERGLNMIPFYLSSLNCLDFKLTKNSENTSVLIEITFPFKSKILDSLTDKKMGLNYFKFIASENNYIFDSKDLVKYSGKPSEINDDNTKKIIVSLKSIEEIPKLNPSNTVLSDSDNNYTSSESKFKISPREMKEKTKKIFKICSNLIKINYDGKPKSNLSIEKLKVKCEFRDIPNPEKKKFKSLLIDYIEKNVELIENEYSSMLKNIFYDIIQKNEDKIKEPQLAEELMKTITNEIGNLANKPLHGLQSILNTFCSDHHFLEDLKNSKQKIIIINFHFIKLKCFYYL